MQKHPIFCRAKLDFEKTYKSMHWNSVVEQQTIGRVQQTGGATITMLHRVTRILYFKLQAKTNQLIKFFRVEVGVFIRGWGLTWGRLGTLQIDF